MSRARVNKLRISGSGEALVRDRVIPTLKICLRFIDSPLSILRVRFVNFSQMASDSRNFSNAFSRFPSSVNASPSFLANNRQITLPLIISRV